LSLVCLAALAGISPLPAQDRSADPYVAVALKVTPPVLLQRAGEGDLTPLKADDLLYPGDRVVCRSGGRASLIFADSAVEIKLQPDTEVTLQGRRTEAGVIKSVLLHVGDLLTRVKEGAMEVVTPSCVASVKGTQWWTRVDSNARTLVVVLEGSVRVEHRASGLEQEVAAGQTGTAASDGDLEVEPTRNEDLPSLSSEPEQGSLDVEFQDGDGRTRTLHIDFNR